MNPGKIKLVLYFFMFYPLSKQSHIIVRGTHLITERNRRDKITEVVKNCAKGLCLCKVDSGFIKLDCVAGLVILVNKDT